MIEFKIEDFPDQQFATTLEGRRVTIRLRYNITMDRWTFDLSIDDLPVLHGRVIVLGVDFLKPFHFGIGVMFAAAMTAGAQPNRAQLPNGEVKIFQASEDEINEAIS